MSFAAVTIEWSLLARVVITSLAAGLGVVVVFGLALIGVNLAKSTTKSLAVKSFGSILGVVAGTTLLWALWLSYHIMTTKS